MSDMIDRQDAIDAIMSKPPDAHYPSWYADVLKGLPSACNKTKQQATVSSDLISRQETVKTITSYNGVVDKSVAKRLLLQMPSAEPEIIHCKDCRNRGEDECPMRHVERRERNE